MKRVLKLPCLGGQIRIGLTNPHFDKILSVYFCKTVCVRMCPCLCACVCVCE